MAADMNSVNLVGRLTRDPELRHTAGGTPICNMRIASSTRGKDDEGNWTDKPNYFDVTVWGGQGEAAAQHLSKGRRIGISGELRWREWTAKDGSNRQTVEINCDNLYYLDSREDGDAPKAAPAELPVEDNASAAQPNGGGTDDIPF